MFAFVPIRHSVGRSLLATVWSGKGSAPPVPGRFVIDGISTDLAGHSSRSSVMTGCASFEFPGSPATRGLPCRWCGSETAATRLLLSRGFDPNETVAVDADPGPSSSWAVR